MSEITCPSCGTVSHLEDLDRSSECFCRVCDYPLFWVRSAQVGVGAGGSGTGLRRLPGTAGRVALATIACPACTEPNPVTANICIRCGADLHPAPVVEAEPPPVVVPPPPPAPAPPPPPRAAWWPWVLVGVLFVAAVVALVLLLAT